MSRDKYLKILTIIPARCGSKGVPDKNIIDICGKPLISYSIEQALALKKKGLVDTVIVSTDCKKISDISIKYGASVPFLRPKEISTDESKSIDYYMHAIDFFEDKGVFFDAILLLQPTSPIRSHKLLIEAIQLFNEKENDSLISVYEEEYINDLVMYKLDKLNNLVSLNRLHNKGVRRQDHSGIYVRNGTIYITKIPFIKNTKTIVSDNSSYIQMSKLDSVNIDTTEDLYLARLLIQKKISEKLISKKNESKE
jgi:CMP-N,N'-diacetyllegionaminic acid synthase